MSINQIFHGNAAGRHNQGDAFLNHLTVANKAIINCATLVADKVNCSALDISGDLCRINCSTDFTLTAGGNILQSAHGFLDLEVSPIGVAGGAGATPGALTLTTLGNRNIGLGGVTIASGAGITMLSDQDPDLVTGTLFTQGFLSLGGADNTNTSASLIALAPGGAAPGFPTVNRGGRLEMADTNNAAGSYDVILESLIPNPAGDTAYQTLSFLAEDVSLINNSSTSGSTLIQGNGEVVITSTNDTGTTAGIGVTIVDDPVRGLAFYGETPIARPSGPFPAADGTLTGNEAAINAIRTALLALGLIA